jgi:hypothetical protein
VQLRESAGAWGIFGVGACGVGVAVKAGAGLPVQPAIRTAAIQTMRIALIFVSMYIGIGSGKYKHGEDCGECEKILKGVFTGIISSLPVSRHGG